MNLYTKVMSHIRRLRRKISRNSPIAHGLNMILNLILYRCSHPSSHLIFPDQQLIFIDIPKNASSSIKASLLWLTNIPKNEIDEKSENIHRQDWNSRAFLTRTERNQYHAFFVLRDPFDRIESLYQSKFINDPKIGRDFYFDRYPLGIHQNMNFEEFVRCISKIPDWLSDSHFKSQTQIVKMPKYGNLTTLLYDDLSNQFLRNVVKKHPDAEPLPHFNQSKKRKERSLYTPKIRKMVADRYENDIRLYRTIAWSNVNEGS